MLIYDSSGYSKQLLEIKKVIKTYKHAHEWFLLVHYDCPYGVQHVIYVNSDYHPKKQRKNIHLCCNSYDSSGHYHSNCLQSSGHRQMREDIIVHYLQSTPWNRC